MHLKEIYIFDICGTLYKSNTTFDFLNWLFEKNWKFRFFKRIYTSIIWKLFNKILRVYFHLDLTRILALSFLKGYSKDVLSNYADNFVNTFLSSRKNIEVIQSLEALKIQGKNIVIMSATIDVVAQAIAKSLKIDCYKSSLLKYDDSICQGKLIQDLLGNKTAYLDKQTQIAAVYTDDLSDANLLELAKEKNIIIYSRTAKKWSNLLKRKQWNANLISS